ncbi:SprT family zinc-dependent metalloprotease [Marinilabiliaceae bacterium ANBcel2]|nr:SprT family zinc-dependent metalloprotease [Marinilabiliaceae bacterium ANBcel2]
MSGPFLINIEDIGKVLFRTDRRCKRISIRIEPIKGVRVSYPLQTSFDEALTFLISRKKWVLTNLELAANRVEKRYTIFDENTIFKARTFSLKIGAHNSNLITVELNNGYLKVCYPKGSSVKADSFQNAVRLGIEEALRIEAKRLLPGRVHYLSKKNGIRYNRLFIKKMKTRWGSCSQRDNINLNIHMMRLPDHLVDYVLLHELCHIIHKNHGTGFKVLLNRLTHGRAPLYEEEIKQYSTTIY